MPGGFGRDHHHVDVLARLHLTVMDIEPVRECKRRSLADVRLDFVAIDRGDVLVGHEHHDEIGALHRFADFRHLEPRLPGLVP